jgi:HD superfamily phosphohydrolase
MSSKVFRDPLYNYVSIDLSSDQWLLEVLNSREIQRLRRIHQLGVSSLTYPGADHNRLVHSLGVMHLMQMAIEHFAQDHRETQFDLARPVLLAAALVHDVGHGPFSHLFEPCLGIDHEDWSRTLILDPSCDVNKNLKACDSALPQAVADLINPDNQDRPPWQKYLISSQLDLDRLDYLRRDSLFTGAGYGHFDWHRLIKTMEFEGDTPNEWEIVWGSKAMLAIEEYVFARYYMYQNVYLHKTTRGFEQMLIAMWRYARELRHEGIDVNLMPAISAFWESAETVTSQQYLAIEEFTVLNQIETWRTHTDRGLRDLADRFMNRVPLAMVEAPDLPSDFSADLNDFENALLMLVERDSSFQPGKLYCLKDTVKPKYNQPYFPEKEEEEQTVKNAIRVRSANGTPVEISTMLPRMRPITDSPTGKVRYYVPTELRNDAQRLRDEWKFNESVPVATKST